MPDGRGKLFVSAIPKIKGSYGPSWLEGDVCNRSFRDAYMRILFLLSMFLFWMQAEPCAAKSKPAPRSSLREYLERVTPSQTAPGSGTPGSLWSDNGKLADLAADYKAHHNGDLVEIVIVHDTVAENSGDVASDRSFQTSSGIQSLPAH